MLKKDPKITIEIDNKIIQMACAYALLNEKENAILSLKKAIEINPDYKFLAMDDENLKDIINFV